MDGDKELLALMIRAVFSGMDGDAKKTGSDMSAHMPTLYLLARHSPGPIVECGVGRGFSTIALIAGSMDGSNHLTSYDANRGCEESVFRNLGIPSNSPQRDIIRRSWAFSHGDSVKSSSLWASQSIGLWFLDTSHRYENTIRELEAWNSKIKPNGIMCGHDYHLKDAGVQRAVDEFVSARKNRFRLQICRYDQGLFILWPL